MSRYVDAERAREAELERSYRQERLLRELLQLVLLRREKLPTSVITERLERHRNVIGRREQWLEELLEGIARKGFRRST